IYCGLYHFVARILQDFRYTPSEEVVAKMPEMQRLVGVGRGVLHDYRLAGGGEFSKSFIGIASIQKIRPVCIGDHEVEKPLDHIVRSNERRTIGLHSFTKFIAQCLG